MSKFSMSEKVNRTLALLNGLRRDSVLNHLAQHGLEVEDLEEGRRLVEQALGEQVKLPLRSAAPAGLVAELDAFETKWLVVAESKLKRRFPAIAQQLSVGVDRSNARNAMWNVPQFLERIGKMEREEAPFGAEGPPARLLLAKLGLTEAEVARGQALVERITAFETTKPPAVPDTNARDAAMAAMWAWYLEWSTVARKFIDDGVVLRSLGFGRRTKKDEVEESPAQPLLPGMANAPALLAAYVAEPVKKAG